MKPTELIVRFLFHSFAIIGHPGYFVLYSLILAKGTFGHEALTILDQASFYYVTSNTYRLNMILFVPFAVIVNIAWISLQFGFIRLFSPISPYAFYRVKSNRVVIPLLGWMHLQFMAAGIEGNGYIFIFLPMLALLGISVITFIYDLIRGCMGKVTPLFTFRRNKDTAASDPS